MGGRCHGWIRVRNLVLVNRRFRKMKKTKPGWVYICILLNCLLLSWALCFAAVCSHQGLNEVGSRCARSFCVAVVFPFFFMEGLWSDKGIYFIAIRHCCCARMR